MGRWADGVSKGKPTYVRECGMSDYIQVISCLCLVPKHKTPRTGFSSRQYPYGDGLIDLAQPKVR